MKVIDLTGQRFGRLEVIKKVGISKDGQKIYICRCDCGREKEIRSGNLRSGKCDGGDILLQRVMFIDPDWDYHELWREMFLIGVDMVSDAVRMIGKGGCEWQRQDERFATWEPSWERPRLHRNELIQIGW